MTTENANLGNDGGNGSGNEGAGAGDAPAWMAQLDKDLQGHERLTQFKTIGEMGRAFLDTEGKVKNAVVIPGENATDEERAAYYQKLGRPEKVEGYELKKPEKLPEGVPYSPEMIAAFSNLAFEAGLSKSQTAKIHDWYYGSVAKGAEMQKKADEKELQDSINSLKNEWKGDTYKTNEEIAIRGFKTFSKDVKDAETLLETAKIGNVKLGNHPAFLKLFHKIGQAIMDDSAHSSGDKGFGELSDEDKAKTMFPSMAG